MLAGDLGVDVQAHSVESSLRQIQNLLGTWRCFSPLFISLLPPCLCLSAKLFGGKNLVFFQKSSRLGFRNHHYLPDGLANLNRLQ